MRGYLRFGLSFRDSKEIMAERNVNIHVPAYNPMPEAKVELGKYLFYDMRISVNGKQSCTTCHKQKRAFTDGRAVRFGATGEPYSRRALSMVSVAWTGSLTSSRLPR